MAEAWSSIPSLLGALTIRGMSTLGASLVIGVTVLTIAILILSRSRWGQVKPISKCIALSVFAHFLMLIFAYDTEMFVSNPAGRFGSGHGQGIPVAFIDDDEAENVSDANLAVPSDTSIVDSPNDKPPDEQPIPSNPPTESTKTPAVAKVDAVATKSNSESQSDKMSAAQPPSVPQAVQSPSPPLVNAPALLARPDTVAATERKEGENPPNAIEVAPTPSVEPPAPEPSQNRAPSAIASTPQRIDEPALDLPDAEVLSDRNEQLQGVGADGAFVLPRASAVKPNSARATPPPAEVVAPPAPQPSPASPTSGAASTAVYANRQNHNRLQIALRYGGNERSEGAVDGALQWLAAAQSKDGRWDADRFGAGKEAKILGHDRKGAGAQADTGITGLALLTFLAAGETHLSGDYRSTVEAGLVFLIQSQGSDGNLAGDAEVFAKMYCHGMAMLALSEAYAMTNDERLMTAVEKAAQYTIRSQHAGTGGWRYLPADQGDMSQFGWQVMALKSASMGGIPIPTRTWSGTRKFLQLATSGRAGGLGSYRPGERPSTTMTAEALACRYFLGEYGNSAIVEEAGSFIIQELPDAKRPNFYNWYYGTLALFQVQDSRWERWNRSLQTALIDTQRLDGALAGSWDPDPIWGNYGGRIYSTALGSLCLEVYYRYLPLTQVEGMQTARGRSPRMR